jgi:hypothetical protein
MKDHNIVFSEAMDKLIKLSASNSPDAAVEGEIDNDEIRNILQIAVNGLNIPLSNKASLRMLRTERFHRHVFLLKSLIERGEFLINVVAENYESNKAIVDSIIRAAIVGSMDVDVSDDPEDLINYNKAINESIVGVQDFNKVAMNTEDVEETAAALLGGLLHGDVEYDENDPHNLAFEYARYHSLEEDVEPTELEEGDEPPPPVETRMSFRASRDNSNFTERFDPSNNDSNWLRYSDPLINIGGDSTSLDGDIPGGEFFDSEQIPGILYNQRPDSLIRGNNPEAWIYSMSTPDEIRAQYHLDQLRSNGMSDVDGNLMSAASAFFGALSKINDQTVWAEYSERMSEYEEALADYNQSVANGDINPNEEAAPTLEDYGVEEDPRYVYSTFATPEQKEEGGDNFDSNAALNPDDLFSNFGEIESVISQHMHSGDESLAKAVANDLKYARAIESLLSMSRASSSAPVYNANTTPGFLVDSFPQSNATHITIRLRSLANIASPSLRCETVEDVWEKFHGRYFTFCPESGESSPVDASVVSIALEAVEGEVDTPSSETSGESDSDGVLWTALNNSPSGAAADMSAIFIQHMPDHLLKVESNESAWEGAIENWIDESLADNSSVGVYGGPTFPIHIVEIIKQIMSPSGGPPEAASVVEKVQAANDSGAPAPTAPASTSDPLSEDDDPLTGPNFVALNENSHAVASSQPIDMTSDRMVRLTIDQSLVGFDEGSTGFIASTSSGIEGFIGRLRDYLYNTPTDDKDEVEEAASEKVAETHQRLGIKLNIGLLPNEMPAPYDYRPKASPRVGPDAPEETAIGHPNNGYGINQRIKELESVRQELLIRKASKETTAEQRKVQNGIDRINNAIGELQRLLAWARSKEVAGVSARKQVEGEVDRSGYKTLSYRDGAENYGRDERSGSLNQYTHLYSPKFYSEVLKKCRERGVNIQRLNKDFNDKALSALVDLGFLSSEDYETIKSVKEEVKKDWEENKRSVCVLTNAVSEGRSNGLVVHDQAGGAKTTSWSPHFEAAVEGVMRGRGKSSGAPRSHMIFVSDRMIQTSAIKPAVVTVNCTAIAAEEMEVLIGEVWRQLKNDLIKKFSDDDQAQAMIKRFRIPRTLLTRIKENLGGLDLDTVVNFMERALSLIANTFVNDNTGKLMKAMSQHDKFIKETMRDIGLVKFKNSGVEIEPQISSVKLNEYLLQDKSVWSNFVEERVGNAVSEINDARRKAAFYDYCIDAGCFYGKCVGLDNAVAEIKANLARVKELLKKNRQFESNQIEMTIDEQEADKEELEMLVKGMGAVANVKFVDSDDGECGWFLANGQVSGFDVDEDLHELAKVIPLGSGKVFDTVAPELKAEIEELSGKYIKVKEWLVDKKPELAEIILDDPITISQDSITEFVASLHTEINTQAAKVKETRNSFPPLSLLHGFPGTGKSIFAEVLSDALDIPWAVKQFQDFITGGQSDPKFVGGTDKNITDFVNMCDTAENLILLLDEADHVFAGEGNESTGGEIVSGLIARLLVAWDSGSLKRWQDSNFYIILTTNREWVIREAGAGAIMNRIEQVSDPYEVELPSSPSALREMFEGSTLINNLLRSELGDKNSNLIEKVRELERIYKNPDKKRLQAELIAAINDQVPNFFIDKALLRPDWIRRERLSGIDTPDLSEYDEIEDFFAGIKEVSRLFKIMGDQKQITYVHQGQEKTEFVSPLDHICLALSEKATHRGAPTESEPEGAKTNVPKVSMRNIGKMINRWLREHRSYLEGNQNALPLTYRTVYYSVGLSEFGSKVSLPPHMRGDATLERNIQASSDVDGTSMLKSLITSNKYMSQEALLDERNYKDHIRRTTALSSGLKVNEEEGMPMEIDSFAKSIPKALGIDNSLVEGFLKEVSSKLMTYESQNEITTNIRSFFLNPIHGYIAIRRDIINSFLAYRDSEGDERIKRANIVALAVKALIGVYEGWNRSSTNLRKMLTDEKSFVDMGLPDYENPAGVILKGLSSLKSIVSSFDDYKKFHLVSEDAFDAKVNEMFAAKEEKAYRQSENARSILVSMRDELDNPSEEVIEYLELRRSEKVDFSAFDAVSVVDEDDVDALEDKYSQMASIIEAAAVEEVEMAPPPVTQTPEEPEATEAPDDMPGAVVEHAPTQDVPEAEAPVEEEEEEEEEVPDIDDDIFSSTDYLFKVLEKQGLLNEQQPFEQQVQDPSVLSQPQDYAPKPQPQVPAPAPDADPNVEKAFSKNNRILMMMVSKMEKARQKINKLPHWDNEDHYFEYINCNGRSY